MHTKSTIFHSAKPSVSVIVPALNEEESIGWVIDNIPAWVSEIVLVDGLSVDGTELVVRDRRPDTVIVHQRSRGKGAALRAGFAAASGDIIVMIDADGSTDPREMGRFVDALVAGADFVKGSRNLTGGGSVDFTLLRHWGNLGFVYAANLLFGSKFTDLCYGYCAFWAKDLNRLALTADGFEIEMELVLSAVKAGLSIIEVPSMELERRAGNSNLKAWKDGKRVLKTMIIERLRKLSYRNAAGAKITLIPTLVPAHQSRQWLPAGSDTRSAAEHAQADELALVMVAANADRQRVLEILSAYPASTETEPAIEPAIDAIIETGLEIAA
jgi:glycosyltransferase involved in cell wall biosynthesis